MAQFTEYVYQNQVGHQVSLAGRFVHNLYQDGVIKSEKYS